MKPRKPSPTFKTDLQVEKLKPKAARYAARDLKLEGHYCRVTPRGVKTFVCVARDPYGDQIWLSIGKPGKPGKGGLSLENARERARGMIQAIKDGEDPNPPPKEKPATYKAAVEDYHERFQVGEKGNTTAGETKRVLLKEGGDWLNAPVTAITPKIIWRVLEEIRDGKRGKKRPYLANRTHAHMRRFFAWCAEPQIDLLERSPMEGLKKPWAGEEPRDRVFSDDELRSLWKGADSLGDYVGGHLRVVMLTGKRKTAVAEMKRGDIDSDWVWRHPEAVDPMAKRGKRRNKRIHICPLPSAAQNIIADIPEQLDDKDRANPYLFPGRVKDRPLVPGTSVQKMVAKVSEIPDFFHHACRHTVETRLAKLGIPPHIRDMVLDHTPQRGAGAAYDHHEYLEEMRHALDTWAANLADIVAGRKDETVVTMEKKEA